MKVHLATATALVAAFIGVPAMAKDASETFNGVWAAAIAGYDLSKERSSQPDNLNGPHDKQVQGMTYGVVVGYNADLGHLVLGGEGEVTTSTAESQYGANGYVPANYFLASASAGRDIYVGARLGFTATPRTLVYVKGGYTNARFEYVGSNGVGTFDVHQHLNTDGWRVGAGIEQQLGRGVFAKLEYRYSNYGSKINFAAPSYIFEPSTRFKINTDRHQLVAGLGTHF